MRRIVLEKVMVLLLTCAMKNLCNKSSMVLINLFVRMIDLD